MLLLTLRGTPTLYMGDELGMEDTAIPSDEVRDPAERRQPGKGLGRDPVRTPFPWQDRPGRGFTTGTPWLRFGEDAPLDRQHDDPRSMLSLYRAVIAIRRQHAALSSGGIADVQAHGTVLTYSRYGAGERFLVALNLSSEPAAITAPAGMVVASTHPFSGQAADRLRLDSDQGILLRVDP